MKILAPIGSESEVEMLAENGAGEFYSGVTPNEWIEKFSPGVWINRRNPFAGIASFQELKRLVERSHTYGIDVYLTLNAPYYIDAQYPLLIELIKYCTEEIGIDAFVVSDIGLMVAMSEQVPSAKIHVSSVAASLNIGSLQLYKQLGATRIVLPRSVQLLEIEQIKKVAGDEMEIEVFILNDGCVYEESFCMTTHNRVSAFCAQWQWDYEPLSSDGNKVISELERGKLAQEVKDYREYVWFVNDSGGKVDTKGLPLGPCGLCAIPKLHEIGVDSLKIVGREGAAYRKLASLQVVHEILSQVNRQIDPEKVKENAKAIRNHPEFCQSGLMCYYR